MTEAEHALNPGEIDAFYQVAGARRDVRNGFLPDPVADEVLARVLDAAHPAPSVGLAAVGLPGLRDEVTAARCTTGRAPARVLRPVAAQGARPRFPRSRSRRSWRRRSTSSSPATHPRRPAHPRPALAAADGPYSSCWRWRTCGWPPGPRASASAGSPSSTSANSPRPRPAYAPRRSWPTCASATSSSSRRAGAAGPAGPRSARWPGRCTRSGTAGARCPAPSPLSLLGETHRRDRPARTRGGGRATGRRR